VGREAMNAELIGWAAELRPDVCLFVLFGEEISTATIRSVGRASGAPTINWFADDHWRFDDFTRRFAPAFDWSVTTDPDSIARYHAIGYRRVILSQWACNRYAYYPSGGPVEYPITFVGQPYGHRRSLLRAVRDAGFDLRCWGYGWPEGRLTHDQMVRVFGTSAINLNLSHSSANTPRMRAAALLRGKRLDARARRNQIKSRTFEVLGCGGFLLTDAAPNLERYVLPGVEVAVFHGMASLLEQLRYWLSHEQERSEVAAAGYRRVLSEHTYDHRFAAIFEAAGLA
jgi:spore maturation protein CgeB